jgi:crotonobetaine/carnitine-CoA ligase
MRFVTGEKYILGGMLEEAVKKHPEATYFWFEGERYTYSRVLERSRRIAQGFAKQGVKKGHHVAVLMENCPEFIYTWFGLALLGAVEAPFNPFHKGSLLEYLINFSDAEILVISSSFIEEIRSVEDRISKVKKIIIEGQFRGSL